MKQTFSLLIVTFALFSFAHHLDVAYPYSLGVVIPIGFIMAIGVIFALMTFASACDWLLNDQSPEYRGRKKIKKTRA